MGHVAKMVVTGSGWRLVGEEKQGGSETERKEERRWGFFRWCRKFFGAWLEEWSGLEENLSSLRKKKTLRKMGLRREYQMGWMEAGGSAGSRGFQQKERRRHREHTDSSFGNFVFISGFWFNKPVPLLNPTKTRLLMDPFEKKKNWLN